MNSNKIEDVCLTTQQSEQLLKNLFFPSGKTAIQRDAFLSDIADYKFDIISDTAFNIEIPNLDLSFLDNKIENEIILSDYHDKILYENEVAKTSFANYEKNTISSNIFFDGEQNDSYYAKEQSTEKYNISFFNNVKAA